MRWYGLTGGIACGKSAVSDLLLKSSVPVVDADKIAREVVAPGSLGLDQVVTAFGVDVLAQDGSLDRKSLGNLIFGNPEKIQKLNAIMHPLIRKKVQDSRNELERQGHSFAVYDIPLLFETNSKENFDGVIVVSTTPELQLERLMGRGLSRHEAQQRLNSQKPLAYKTAEADFVIHNVGTPQDLEKEVQKLIQWLKH